jgi:hypothetical protein
MQPVLWGKEKSLKRKSAHQGSTLFSFVGLPGGPRVIFKYYESPDIFSKATLGTFNLSTFQLPVYYIFINKIIDIQHVTAGCG